MDDKKTKEEMRTVREFMEVLDVWHVDIDDAINKSLRRVHNQLSELDLPVLHVLVLRLTREITTCDVDMINWYHRVLKLIVREIDMRKE